MKPYKLSVNRRNLVAIGIAIASFLVGGLSACSSLNHSSSSAQPNTSAATASQTAPAQSNSAANPVPAPSVVAPPASAMSTPPTGEHLVGSGSETVITIHGKIAAVNRAKKQVTLEGPNGKKVTIHVYNPYNLAAAKPGAPFVAKFYEIVTIQKTKPGVVTPSASVANGIVSAAPGQTPGGAVASGVQLVVTIDSIDKEKGTVSVKGADGKIETVSVANPKDLKHLKPGDGIIVTLWNVVAIALEKESAT
jgi:hypothetical protein